jgi:polysaccharide pyruvyl transferase WcaK-like protein
MIAVIHAYSRHNAGDGLLVDLTLRRLAGAGVRVEDCVVLSMDPPSFADLPHVVKIGTRGRSADLETATAAVTGAATVLGARVPTLAAGKAARALRDAEAYVAVGGGYLRAGTRTNVIGTAINHLPQLEAAAASGRPSIYLPQSVGPLTGRVGDRVRTLLHRMSSVHLRDDRSMVEVGGGATIHRTGDLAVLELADRLEQVHPQEVPGSPVIVARALTDAPTYHERLRRLAELLGDARWGVQAEGDSTKSDRVFYTDTLHVEPAGRVAELLAGPEPGPVVSVRLHGALQSLLAGVPAVHLGYERKSWGAYADLGLSRWVHSARGFDPELVAAQVRELAVDAGPFWAAVGERAGALRASSEALTDELARRLGR